MKPGTSRVDNEKEPCDVVADGEPCDAVAEGKPCDAGEGGGGFDQVLRQLETVVDQLEQSEMPLEQALAAFEKGVGLSRRAQSVLDAAERKVEVLMRDGTTEPLDSHTER